MKYLVVGFLMFFSIAIWAEESAPEKTDGEPASESESVWKHRSDLATSFSSGNTDTTTINTQQTTSYYWGDNGLRLDAMYLYTIASGIEAAKNWKISLRYERILSKDFSVFVANGWEGDRFAGYDYRSTVDVGGKYNVIGNSKQDNYLITEGGYRYQYEQRLPGTTPFVLNSHIIRVYAEANRALTESLAVNFWIELLPDLANTDNFTFNFQPSLEMILNKYFSVRFAYLGKYDAAPATASLKKYDSLLTIALVAKY